MNEEMEFSDVENTSNDEYEFLQNTINLEEYERQEREEMEDATEEKGRQI